MTLTEIRFIVTEAQTAFNDKVQPDCGFCLDDLNEAIAQAVYRQLRLSHVQPSGVVHTGCNSGLGRTRNQC